MGTDRYFGFQSLKHQVEVTYLFCNEGLGLLRIGQEILVKDVIVAIVVEE